ncbi:MAG TPA: hypothetical protein VNG12_10960 [Acidimicrobiales bacterium]|nr:hypothetical protein [Acidimicrobiales bacterium]
MAPWLITSMGLPVLVTTGTLVRLGSLLSSQEWILLAALSAVSATVAGATTTAARLRRRQSSRHESAS